VQHEGWNQKDTMVKCCRTRIMLRHSLMVMTFSYDDMAMPVW